MPNKPGFLPARTGTACWKLPQPSCAPPIPGSFEFSHGLNGFSARRPYFIYGGLASAFGREQWDIKTEQTPAGIRASASVFDAGDVHGGLAIGRYNDVAISPAVYRLFWSRVEFVLGRRPDWVTCRDAGQWLAGVNPVTGLYGLCGSETPPPPQMAPLRRGRAYSAR